ncbi:hypothetical protein [Halomonas sp. BC04]|uniref:hypothetical protein n=1 Tax=Halomonas sp. BC04 TaxID=1403540 RepID=UPI0012DBD4BD|nr:hypothetical protein [Halomonas sp. BC04]
MSVRLDWLSTRPWCLGVSVAIATCVISWFVQLVILGVIVPEWSDGNGLIPGQDVSGFHRVAAAQAELIALHGWSAWELRPNGWGISGLMSAWYVITVPAPWSLVPLQAAMYGTCVAVIYGMLLELGLQRRLAAIALLPALLLPSGAMIYAQPHRDVVVFFGLMLAIQGWWWLACIQRINNGWAAARLAVSGSALVFIGFILSWIVRAFSGEIFQGLAGLVIIVLVVFALAACMKYRRLSCYTLASPLLVLLVLIAMNQFHSGGHFSRYLDEVDTAPRTDTDMADLIELEGWLPTSWLPSAIDDRLRRYPVLGNISFRVTAMVEPLSTRISIIATLPIC